MAAPKDPLFSALIMYGSLESTGSCNVKQGSMRISPLAAATSPGRPRKNCNGEIETNTEKQKIVFCNGGVGGIAQFHQRIRFGLFLSGRLFFLGLPAQKLQPLDLVRRFSSAGF